MNKDFLKSVMYSNLSFIGLLGFLYLILISEILNNFFGYDSFFLKSGVINTIFLIIISYFIILIYFKFKYIKYNYFYFYLSDFLLSFLGFLFILLFSKSVLKLITFYLIVSLLLTFIFYYFKNIKVLNKIKEKLK